MNMRYCWATSALWAVLVISKLSLREASVSDRAVIGVVTPDTIARGEEVTIRWNFDDGNGASSGRFDIALYDCDDAFCGQFYCGNFIADFCDKPEIGCSDMFGDFQITVPTDIPTGDSYKIRVGLHGTDIYDCSSTFSIVEEIPVPTLEVFIPTVLDGEWESDYVFDDDSASTVIESTVEILGGRARALQSFSGAESSSAAVAATDAVRVSWKYDDGFGGTFARFNIDLYYCGGGCQYTQGCGELVARLCDACPDSAGNEAVTLPNPYGSYNYKIRVSTSNGVSRPVSACSPKFQILGRDRPGYSTPTPTSSSVATEPVPDPRASLSPPAGDLPATPEVRPAEFPDWGAESAFIEQPACDSNVEPPAVRYASSTGRIYVERNGTRGGCFTLSDIWDAGNTVNMPLYRIEPSTNRRVEYNTGVWLLTEDLYVRDGVTLQIHGRAKGGDCDELRLSSNGSTLINLRAHGASFSFLGTKVTSWDEGEGTVDYNYEDGRSYISTVSEVIYDDSETCDGAAKDNMGEARMDVIDSEIAYLGYHASESYGLVWKVRGFCVDKSNPEVFDHVDVYGDIINSNIHDNYFGMYSYGHYGGNWSFNKMHGNVAYGFDPHDDSDYLTIEGNDVWGNGNHGIIASKRCDHVRMLNNHVSWGRQAGLFLHRSTDFAIVKGNHVHDNGDAGVAFLESFYAEVTGNVFKNNKYGVRFSVGASYNWVYNNVLANSRKYHLFTYLGSDPTDIPGTLGNPTGIVFWRNYLSGTRYQVLKVKEAEDLVVVNNRIDGASTTMFVESTDVQYRDNEEEDGLVHVIELGVCFTADSTLDPKC